MEDNQLFNAGGARLKHNGRTDIGLTESQTQVGKSKKVTVWVTAMMTKALVWWWWWW